MTTCIVFPVDHLHITRLDRRDIDIWAPYEEDAVESKVGLVEDRLREDREGQYNKKGWRPSPENWSKEYEENQKKRSDPTYRPDLRKSFSVLDCLELNYPPTAVDNYFTSLYIGPGSKHVYYAGNFMKEHYDTRHPDILPEPRDGRKREQEEKLKHIMTLIITDSISELRVNGCYLGQPHGREYISKYGVLFSLNCPHEVKPVENTRVSLVFPVYGVYDPTTKLVKNIKCKSSYRVSEIVFEQVESVIYSLTQEYFGKQNTRHIEYAELAGYTRALHNDSINAAMLRVRDISGEYIDRPDYSSLEETPYMFYDYTRTDSSFGSGFTKDPICYENCKSIKVNVVKPIVSLLMNVRDKIKDIIEEEDAKEEKLKGTEENEAKKGSIHFDPTPFVLVLANRYYNDAKVEDLSPVDKNIYNHLLSRERRVTFVPAGKPENVVNLYFLGPNGLSRENVLERPEYTSELSSDFDDGGSYDPHYSLTYGLLVVE